MVRRDAPVKSSAKASCMELAAELLEVQGRAGTRSLPWQRLQEGQGSSRTPRPAKAVGGMLKGVLKKALPIAGGVAGTFFGGPVGATIGSKLGSMAGNLFELELEGLSQEDREFEAAKQFARFASDAVRTPLPRRAAIRLPSRGPPSRRRRSVMRRGLLNMLRRVVERNVVDVAAVWRRGRPRSGRWRRVGPNRIIVENC